MSKLLILLFCCLSFLVNAQKGNNSLPILLQLQEGMEADAFLQQYRSYSKKGAALQIERRISKLFNIYKLKSNSTLSGNSLIESLQKTKGVIAVGYDTPVNYRNNSPNDNFFKDQWNLEKISLPEVWAETTGGATANGDEIVVAVLEIGMNLEHPDIAVNIWENTGEIPNNGIDEDNNGYIDDHRGLNLEELTDLHPVLDHGTEVAGIIGANTDNDLGIAGINWKVKLLPLSNIDLASEVIEAFEYIYNLRKKYNDTNGREGALIVANNLSFGFDNIRPEELLFGVDLCNMLDVMGSVGVLTVGAGPNSDVDVERVGDTPSNCESRYFIGVTSTNRQDEKTSDAGYGLVSIDIGAPGEEVLAPRGEDAYCTCDGTSFAAPHISGVIALMYSIPCTQLANDVIKNASGTARFIKDILLAGVDPISSLQNRTVSGGRVNVLKAMSNLQAYCGGNQSSDLRITNIYPSPVQDELTIEYETPNFRPYTLVISNALGQVIQSTIINPPRFSKPIETENVAGLSKGVYFLSLQQDGKIVAKRFVVR